MKKHLDKIIFGVSVALAVAAILSMLAPAVVAKSGGGSYSVFEAAFGKSENNALLGEIKALDASAAMLPFLLVIVGVCLTVVALIGKGGKIAPLAAAGVFVVAGVLYFMSGLLLSPHYYDIYSTYFGVAGKSEYVKYLRDLYSLGYGSVLCGVFSILAGLTCAVPVVLKKAAH